MKGVLSSSRKLFHLKKSFNSPDESSSKTTAVDVIDEVGDEMKDEAGRMSGRNISFIQLLRFASKSNWALMVLAFAAALVRGTGTLIFTVIYANLVDVFVVGSKLGPCSSSMTPAENR